MEVQYNVGDAVKLSSIRPDGWNSGGKMDHFLGEVFIIKRITQRTNNDYNVYLEPREGFRVNDWSFRLSEIERLATEEEAAAVVADYNAHLEKIKKEKEEKKARFDSSVTTHQAVFEIAKEIFGDNVDIRNIRKEGTNDRFDLIVYFPKIQISNSKGMLHDIKDLYVKLGCTIGMHRDYIAANVHLEGRRTTVTDKELMSDYGHSHMSSIGIASWCTFCLGSSDFAMILQTMRMSSTTEDWTLLFLSLENYLSWESLEGGPYRKIGNISLQQQHDGDSDRQRLQAFKLISGIPTECLEIINCKLTLIENHPALYEYYDKNSQMRTIGDRVVTEDVVQHKFRSHTNGMTRLTFKGNAIEPQLIMSPPEEPTPTSINMDLVRYFNRILKMKLEKFNLSYDYNCKRANSSIARSIRTIQ